MIMTTAVRRLYERLPVARNDRNAKQYAALFATDAARIREIRELGWRVAQFQNTSARYDRRPELGDQHSAGCRSGNACTDSFRQPDLR